MALRSHLNARTSAVKATEGREPALDGYFAQLPRWREESLALRGLVLGCGLDEAVKWGQPCYLAAGRNVAIIHAFKDYCGLGFFQGALLSDPGKILVTPGKVQAGRLLRFQGLDEIQAQADTIVAYVREAVAVAGSGAKVRMRTTEEMAVPVELTQALAKDPALKKAFAALTPGRQRSWLHHISSAKQAATRVARIVKARKDVLTGRGFNER